LDGASIPTQLLDEVISNNPVGGHWVELRLHPWFTRCNGNSKIKINKLFDFEIFQKKPEPKVR
jgi:hypothetical protein